MKKRVAILFGGKSGEHEVSIVSALSIHQALDKAKYDVTLVGIDKTGRWLLPDQTKLLAQAKNPRLIHLNEVHETVSLLPFESKQQFVPVPSASGGGQAPSPGRYDVILPILHGTHGEDGTIQGLLELANIPYVGSGVLGSSLGMDKDMTKRVLRDAGIPIVPFIAVKRSEFEREPEKWVAQAEATFGYPYFVKPSNAGSSLGVHKVKSRKDAVALWRDTFKYDIKALAEQGIDAREIECSVLGNHDPQASTLGEIRPKAEFYSYEAKYIDPDGAELMIPCAPLPPGAEAEIQRYAVAAFKVLECAGLARVDFFVDRGSGRIYLNEINTIPGFTQISMYPKLWEASGLPYAKLLDRLIELALERHEEKSGIKTTYDPQS